MFWFNFLIVIFFLLSQGRFELVSLSGMLEVCDSSSGCKRMGNFKVSLMGPDLRPLGGVVANKLIAASSVKVLLSNDKQFMLIFLKYNVNLSYWELIVFHAWRSDQTLFTSLIWLIKNIYRSLWVVLLWMLRRLALITWKLGLLQCHRPNLLLLGLQLVLPFKGLHMSPLVTIRIVLLVRGLEATLMLINLFLLWRCTKNHWLDKLGSKRIGF